MNLPNILLTWRRITREFRTCIFSHQFVLIFFNKGGRTNDVQTNAKKSDTDSKDAKSVVDGINVCVKMCMQKLYEVLVLN